MFGDTMWDSIALGVAALLGWLAEYLRTRFGKKPGETPAPAVGIDTPLQTRPPSYAAFLGRSGQPRKVMLPTWLSLLVMFFPVLKDMISKALDALAERLGREPTPAEAVKTALDAHGDWLEAEKRFYPVDKLPPG